MRRAAVHPLLFGIFPVLFLFRQNLWGLRLGDLVLPMAATVAAVAVIQLLLGFITKRPRKVALCLSVIVLLFFSYGHVWRVFTGDDGELLWTDGHPIIGGTSALVAVIAIFAIVRSRRPLVDLTRVMNAFAIAMVASVALPLGLELMQNRANATPATVEEATLSSAAQAKSKNPDIYYLVFDRYAGARTLDELFAYDNHELLDELRAKGFEIADRSRANYQSSAPSLAASLNMKYLDWIAEEQRGTTSTLPLYEAIRRHEVGRFLKARGYRYVHIGSRWDMTRENPTADVNIRNDHTSEFTRVFFGSTALLPAMRHGLIGVTETDRPATARRVSLRQLNQVVDARRFDGPTFTFAHFGLPHPPYVFDRTGRAIDEQPTGTPAKARAYLQQLEYTNTRIKQIVDQLLDAPEDRQPVVILQADEGPYPSFGWIASNPWWRTTDDKLRTKFRILTAIKMPGVRDTGVYPELSPVNVFRVVFNAYFDAKLDILPDESYVPTDKDTPFVWTRITHRLNDPSTIGPPRYPPRVSMLPLARRTA